MGISHTHLNWHMILLISLIFEYHSHINLCCWLGARGAAWVSIPTSCHLLSFLYFHLTTSKYISLLICSTPFRARDNFEKVKGTYGAASCYLLQLNSRQPGTKTEDIPDPWSHFIHSPTADNVSNMCGLVLKWSLLSQFLHE